MGVVAEKELMLSENKGVHYQIINEEGNFSLKMIPFEKLEMNNGVVRTIPYFNGIHEEFLFKGEFNVLMKNQLEEILSGLIASRIPVE